MMRTRCRSDVFVMLRQLEGERGDAGDGFILRMKLAALVAKVKAASWTLGGQVKVDRL